MFFEIHTWELSCLAIDQVSYTVDLLDAKKKLLIWWLGEDAFYSTACSCALQLILISASGSRLVCYDLCDMPFG